MKSKVQEDQELETKKREPIPTSPLSMITPKMLQDAKAHLKSESLEHKKQPSVWDSLVIALNRMRDTIAMDEKDYSDFDDEGSEDENLVQIFDWVIGLLHSGQLNDDIPAPSTDAEGIRDIFRHSIKTGSLNLDKFFSHNLSTTIVFEKLGEIVNYCEQAFKQISLTANNLTITNIFIFLSQLNLSQNNVLESINFSQKQPIKFVSNSKGEIFISKLMKNTTLKELQWNVNAFSEEEKTMLTNIEDHFAYNNSCAVTIAAYHTLMELLPKVLVHSVVIEYLIGDKDYAPRLLKPIKFSDNCMTFLNTSSPSSLRNNQTNVTCLQFAV